MAESTRLSGPETEEVERVNDVSRSRGRDEGAVKLEDWWEVEDEVSSTLDLKERRES